MNSTLILPVTVLNPAQQQVIDHGLLDSGFSVVLQMPTGSGKTWLAKRAIGRSLQAGFRAVYLSPLRALADELASAWKSDFPDVPVGVFTGDYGRPGRSLPVPYSDARVLIMTPERLDACTRPWRTHWSWIPEVDWLIVDEIHLLGDGHRGARLEGTISRFRRLNPFCRVLGLSATLGNRGQLADWLEGVEWKSDWRPVPLQWKVVRYRKAEEKPALLAAEIARVRDDGGQSLIFVQSRRRSEQLATWLREQGLEALHHHAGLAHDQRREVEQKFRESSTRVLVATSTLEMGLNLPVRQVVLYDLQGFDGVGFEPLTVNTVWQRAGRAGRPGLDPSGEVVLLAPTWDRDVERYERGKFESIRSSLSREDALAEQILAEVNSGLARTIPQLESVLGTSLAAAQAQSLKVPKLVSEMLESGMLREEGDPKLLLKATRLGRIACRHQLQPATVLKIREFLELFETFTDFDLLIVCASTRDGEPALAVDFESLESLAEELARQPSRLFEKFELAATLLDLPGRRLLSSLKVALVIWRWTVLGEAEAVADEEGCYPFEIHRLIESMDRLLLATAAVQRSLDVPFQSEEDNAPTPKSENLLQIELLRQKILNGIEGPAASLTLISGIGSAWVRRLVADGITDLPALAGAKPEELSILPGLSTDRARRWVMEAGEMRFSIPPVVAAKGIPTLPPETDLPVDPYRLRRALDLTVRNDGRDRWEVQGGSEPRRVCSQSGELTCTCPDHAKGNTCKHLLAVRIHLRESGLEAAVRQMDHDTTIPYLDLFSLWFQRP